MYTHSQVTSHTRVNTILNSGGTTLVRVVFGLLANACARVPIDDDG